jgi:hypothetical protein
MDVDLDGATWRKSTYSNGSGGNCVEVTDLARGQAVRDSKRPEGPILVFSKGGWQVFVQGIQAGELCAELATQSRFGHGARFSACAPAWLGCGSAGTVAAGEDRVDEALGAHERIPGLRE